MALRRYLAAIVIAVALRASNASAATTIHPGDTIGVNVLNYAAVIDDSQGRLKSLSTPDVVVAGDGSISLPIIGSIQVAGLTTREIATLVSRRLASYVRDPYVNVTLLAQNQVIFLTGATTGSLAYMPGETLSSALGQLREQIEKDEGASLDPLDKHNGVLIRSAIDLRRIVVESDRHLSTPINGEDLQQSGQPGPKLNPGDTLRFPSKPVRVNVSGQVSAPGPIYLYNNDTLELALVEAGGPLSSASTASATLIRKGQEIPLPLAGASLQQAPQNGDTIVVRPAPHVTVVGQVSTPGEYTLRNGSTLLNALYLSGGPTKWANVKYIEVVHGANREHFDLTGLQHGDLSSNVPLSDGDVVYVPEGHRIDASLFFQAIVGVLAASYDAGHL